MTDENPRTAVVAAAQLGPASARKSDTVTRMVDLVQAAGASGVRLLVFPELSLSPYFATRIQDPAEYIEKQFFSDVTERLVAAAATHGIVMVVPFAEQTDRGVFNSAILLDADGAEAGRYRKMHIPGWLDPDADEPFQILEKRYFLAGDLGFPTYPTAVGNVGMAICYDRRFPETYRCLAISGAQWFAVAFNTPFDPAKPDGRARAVEAHELAVRAGAMSSAVPVVAAGKAGVEGDVHFIGGSFVASHTGEVLARASTDGDELVIAEVDLSAAMDARARLDLVGNRRPDQYAALALSPPSP